MPPININTIYKQVCSFSNDVQDVVPQLFGGKSISSGTNSTGTDAINREFREALFKSLSETGVDKTVLDGLRTKLGMTESGTIPDQALSARDVKDAIESVMQKVSDQIKVALGKDLPFGVQPLILEAVRENPTHSIVKEFLSAGKEGQTMKLAKLCRLTAISQAKANASKAWELGYLNGFSYQVKDVDAQSVHLVGENPRFEEGFGQGKGDFDARLKQDQGDPNVGNESTVKDPTAQVKKNVVPEEKKEEFSQEEFKVRMTTIKGKQEDRDVCRGIEAFGQKILAHGKMLCSMAEKDLLVLKGSLAEISQWKSSLERDVGDGLKVDEKIDIFFVKLMAKCKDTITAEGIQGAIQDAKDAFQLDVLLRKTVKGAEETVRTLTEKVGEGKSQLMTNEKSTFLGEVERLKSTSPAGTLCTKLCEVKKEAQKKSGSTDETVVQAMTEALKKAINQKINLVEGNVPKAQDENKEILSRLDDIGSLKPDDQDVGKKTLGQGKTNMCHVRSIENSLLATEEGRDILLKQVGRTIDNYLFSVNLGNDKKLMVTSTEIEALKTWYAKNHPVSKETLADLKESDWAVNLAIAKMKMFKAVANAMVDDAKIQSSEKKPAEAEIVAKIQNPNVLSVSEDGSKLLPGYEVELQGQKKTYNYEDYLKLQYINEKGYDTDVAELFGLPEADENVAINFTPEGDKPEFRMKELSKTDVFSKWNSVREWRQENGNGVMTLNIGSLHTVAVSSCYYNSDDDFGFCVRDSQNPDAEQRINVIGYGKKDDGMCNTLNVHCYALPSSLLS